MKLTGESKLFLGILIATAAIIALSAWALTRPAPVVALPRETLVPAGSHLKGNSEAAVYLVEFSDFQCPACGEFAPTVKMLTDKYPDRLLFVYRHFPLPSHAFARPAAYAAEAAALQGKFWEAEAYLFANQNSFSDEFFSTTFAQSVQLDQSQFAKDVTSDAVKKAVEQDENAAQLLGLPGTPSFFLNGVLLKNLYGPKDLVRAVEEAISK